MKVYVSIIIDDKRKLLFVSEGTEREVEILRSVAVELNIEAAREAYENGRYSVDTWESVVAFWTSDYRNMKEFESFQKYLEREGGKVLHEPVCLVSDFLASLRGQTFTTRQLQFQNWL